MGGWCCFALLDTRGFQVALVVFLLLDVICVLGTALLDHDGSGKDLLWLGVTRWIVEPLFTVIALIVWKLKANEKSSEEEESSYDLSTFAAESSTRTAELAQPLTTETESTAADSEMTQAERENVEYKRHFKNKAERAVRMITAENRRNVVMACFFTFSTALNMYLGVRVVNYHYSPSTELADQIFLCFQILCVTAEFFTFRDMLESYTEDKGEHLPQMHMHPLYFTLKLKCHVCDICHERTKAPYYEAFRCRTCDFDLCTRCYQRKDRKNFKGGYQIRNDEEQQVTSFTFFTRLIRLSVKFWPTLVLALGSLIVAQGLSLAAPNLQGKIFDTIIAYLRAHTAETHAATDDAREKAIAEENAARGAFAGVIGTYVLINVLQGIFTGLRALSTELVMRKIACAVRYQLFRAIIKMDVAFFDAMHTGQLTSRLTNDAGGMVAPLQTLMNDLISNIILLFGGGLLAFMTSWQLSVLALTVVPPISFIYRIYARWGQKINRGIWQAFGDANSVATEALSNIRTVHAFSTEEYETNRYNEGINVALSYGIKNAFVGASVQAFSTYINLGTSILVLWYGGETIFDTAGQKLSIGNLITFQLYWNMMNTAFISLGNVFNDLIRATSAAERVFSLIEACPEVDDTTGVILVESEIRGKLELKNIRFTYKTRPDNEVLRGVDLTMPAGSTTALVGKSGGGKSTTIHLLLRFYDPTQGEIAVDGVNMRQLNATEFRRHVGFVAQETQLFATSIEENLAYGLGRKYTREELVTACRRANAYQFISEMEDAFDTRTGEKGVLLSGGQKQRLAIARCFLRKPKLLFLDEATSALDTENEAIVQEALTALIAESKATVVLIAHRLSTVMGCDQIAVFNKGVVMELGNHEELLAKNGVYAALVSRQIQKTAGVSPGDKKTKVDNVDDLIAEMEEAGQPISTEDVGVAG
jgi:ABC-type multidrug transport system fused ATPase/permease subunit